MVSGRAALPLLGNLLRLMWDRRDNDTLLASVYDNDLGGIGQALAKSADLVLEEITTENKQARNRAKKLFLALIHPGRGGPDTRRILPLSVAIDALGGEEWRWIVDRLSGLAAQSDPTGTATQRLIFTYCNSDSRQETLVEIAHESLIGRDVNGKPYWPTLSDWIEIERPKLEQRDLLESMARDWKRKGKPKYSGLLSASQLRDLKNVHGAQPPASSYVNHSRRVVWIFRSLITVLTLLLSWSTFFVHSMFSTALNQNGSTFAREAAAASVYGLFAVDADIVRASIRPIASEQNVVRIRIKDADDKLFIESLGPAAAWSNDWRAILVSKYTAPISTKFNHGEGNSLTESNLGTVEVTIIPFNLTSMKLYRFTLLFGMIIVSVLVILGIILRMKWIRTN
jgi:hypothetical protein